MNVRPARVEELSRVFRLTYDLGAGGSVTRHVVACKRDRKLRSGTQFVLENDRGEFLATLTAHVYRHPPVASVVGISNVFTPAPSRRRGYATRLIGGTLDHFDGEGQDVFYLLSDIGPAFYERFGFRPLPVRYDPAPDCVPMLRCPAGEWDRLTGHAQFLRGVMAFVD